MPQEYDYLAKDEVRPVSDVISKWQGVQKNALEIQEKQADQAWGNALAQSTDRTTGVTDFGKAKAIAAGNPMAAAGMQRALQGASTLDTETYNLHTKRMSQANDALGTLIGRYPNGIPQDAAHAAIDQEVSTGLITPAQAQQLKTQFGVDPRQNSRVATQLYSHNMNTQQQLDQTYGKTGTVTGPGGALTGYTQAPASQGGGITTPPQQGAPQGPSPETGVEQVDVTITGPDGKQYPAKVFKKDIPGYGGAAVGGSSTAPANPAGAPAAGSSGIGSGRINSTPANPALRNPAAPAVTPAPQAGGGGGAPGGNQPFVTGPAIGTAEGIKQDQELYGGDVKTMPDMQRRSVAGKAALDALNLVSTTGPMSDKFTRMYAFLQSQGIDPGVNPNDYGSSAAYQVLAKNMLRFAQDTASRSTNTDLGLSTQLHSNANVEDMLPAANRHVLIQDMGLLRQKMAMVKGQEEGGSGYRERTKNFPTDTDATAFAWDMMSPTERQTYLDSIKDNAKAKAKWEKSMRIARDSGVWSSQP